MSIKIVILAVAVSAVVADVSSFYPRVGGHPNSVDYDPNPQYSYSYSVNDAYTGDNHAQEETRQGDNVHGSYSLVEADGTLRTVKYTADPVNGFSAVVSHSGGATRVHGAPAVARIAPLAPIAAPIAPAVPFVAPKIAAAPRPYSLHGGSASVHTSFTAPHATYHY